MVFFFICYFPCSVHCCLHLFSEKNFESLKIFFNYIPLMNPDSSLAKISHMETEIKFTQGDLELLRRDHEHLKGTVCELMTEVEGVSISYGFPPFFSQNYPYFEKKLSNLNLLSSTIKFSFHFHFSFVRLNLVGSDWFPAGLVSWFLVLFWLFGCSVPIIPTEFHVLRVLVVFISFVEIHSEFFLGQFGSISYFPLFK